MPSVSSFDEVNACIQAGFSEKRLYSAKSNNPINGVFNVFVLISVISAQLVFFIIIRVICAICVQNKIFELFVIFDVFGIQKISLCLVRRIISRSAIIWFSKFFFQEYQPAVRQVLEYKEFGLVSLLIKNKSFGLQ